MAEERNFKALLQAQMNRGKMVCVGLDTDTSKLSPQEARLQLRHNFHVIGETHDIAQSYKLNAAFYEGEGDEGVSNLETTVLEIKATAPSVPIILDFKAGDIGNTNLGYIKFAFDVIGADAVTVPPYMGRVDGMQPFLEQEGKGIIVLARTSNAGGSEFQDLVVKTLVDSRTNIRYSSERHVALELNVDPSDFNGRFRPGPPMPLFEFVAHRVAKVWNQYAADCCVVAGATFPSELGRIRRLVGDDMPILIPGLGKQEGEAEATIKNGVNSLGQGIMVNNSRGIIFADDVRKATVEFDQKLRSLRPAPFCSTDGTQMARAGSMFACPSCGATQS